MRTPRRTLVMQADVCSSARESRTHSAIHLGTSFSPSLRRSILSIATAMLPVNLLDRTENLHQSDGFHFISASLGSAPLLGQQKSTAHAVQKFNGWGSWTRTNACGSQNPVPYQLGDTPIACQRIRLYMPPGEVSRSNFGVSVSLINPYDTGTSRMIRNRPRTGAPRQIQWTAVHCSERRK